MKYKVIGCEVLARPIYQCAAQSPHVIDLELIQYGLHQHPTVLRSRIQAAIDASTGKGYDAILLAYGLCGKSTNGLKAPSANDGVPGLKMVLPRAHDCITIFLGGRERYNQQFEQTPGTYWYVQDYLERDDGSGASMAIGANTSAEGEEVYEEYVEKYGRDNADYLMEIMGAWQSHYKRAAYIDLGVGDGSRAEERARNDAARRGWTYERLAGDMVLIRKLLFGEWNEDFLVVEPGQSITMTFDEKILGCALVRG
jgi:hypothetical protein